MAAEAPQFSCTSCLVAFETHQEMKDHYKLDWHIYNSRRKVAGLVPISEEVWNKKWVEMANAKEEAKGTDHKKEKCGKKHEKHHIVFEPWKLGDSLFDNEKFETVEESLEYMRKKYSFYLHEQEYLKDRDGLLTYLAAKIFEGNMCIYCDKHFSSLGACRKHMIDLNHSRIGMDDCQQEEIEGFYDFTTSINEMVFKEKNKRDRVQKLMLQEGKAAAAMAVEDQDEEEVSDDEDGDWEDVDSDGGVLEDLDEDTEVITCENEEEFERVMSQLGLKPASITENGDLTLPDGRVVVHRDVAHIYKQKLGNRLRRQEKEQATRALALENGEDAPVFGLGRRPQTMAQRALAKRNNPFVKVASRAAKRDQKAVLAVLKHAKHDNHHLWINGAAKGPIFKRRMDQNMPHMLKG